MSHRKDHSRNDRKTTKRKRREHRDKYAERVAADRLRRHTKRTNGSEDDRG